MSTFVIKQSFYAIFSAFLHLMSSKMSLLALMRISGWNVRGLGDSNKCTLVKDALLASRSFVVCLQESKLQQMDLRKAATSLPVGLRSFIYMPGNGSSGGLVLA